MGKIILSYEGQKGKNVSGFGNRSYEDYLYLRQHLSQSYKGSPHIVDDEEINDNKELLGEKK